MKAIRMENSTDTGNESRLNNLLVAYREACTIPEAHPNFMPGLWARIESRERSNSIFGRMARGLVTAALAASVVLGLIGVVQEANVPLNGTYIEAVAADHMSNLEAFHLDRISEIEFR